MTIILALFVFAFGAAIGSFLNATVWRLRTGENFVTGRSHCPKCFHKLSAFDLVPILSYLFLRGRCRYCHTGIAWQYVLVEGAVGALFLAAAGSLAPADYAWSTDLLLSLLFHWFVIAGMTVVFLYDLRYMLILRKVTVPLTALAFLGSLGLGMGLVELIVGAAVGFGFFWLQMVFSKGRWIGGGDLHLGLLMGVILGWPRIALALWLAYVVGAVVALALMWRGRHGWKSQLPFGTFLAAATVASLLFGERLLGWYFGWL
jgi:prepilin signal peptidase PulO-like enzyme (type II secretory pathway)